MAGPVKSSGASKATARTQATKKASTTNKGTKAAGKKVAEAQAKPPVDPAKQQATRETAAGTEQQRKVQKGNEAATVGAARAGVSATAQAKLDGKLQALESPESRQKLANDPNASEGDRQLAKMIDDPGVREKAQAVHKAEQGSDAQQKAAARKDMEQHLAQNFDKAVDQAQQDTRNIQPVEAAAISNTVAVLHNVLAIDQVVVVTAAVSVAG